MEQKPMKILIIEDDVNECNNFANSIKFFNKMRSENIEYK